MCEMCICRYLDSWMDRKKKDGNIEKMYHFLINMLYYWKPEGSSVSNIITSDKHPTLYFVPPLFSKQLVMFMMPFLQFASLGIKI